ncbi:MAG TPA: hypothetical protein VM734_33670 [Kofleriaceae bacterium]|nr:hypothetical protein [Kofleriaceae bacterium]
MARPDRYPLERLATLRAQRAAGAAIDLAAALRGEADAEAARAAAVERRDRAVAAARAIALSDGGAAPVWAISRREAYAIRLRRDADRAGEALAAREAELAGWRELVAAARAQMTEARAEREVVDRHRARWQDDQRRDRARRDE